MPGQRNIPVGENDHLEAGESQTRIHRSREVILRLDLFGGLSLRGPGEQPLKVSSRKDAGLLAYLALSPGVEHSRDKLAALLWGQSEQERARHSLRQALSSLRRLMFADRPDGITSSASSVMLAPDLVLTDVAELRRLVRQDTTDSLLHALRLYRGTFMEGIHISEGAFDDWVTFTRQELEREVSAAGNRLVRRTFEAAQHDHVLEGCSKLIEIDPFDEMAHRTLMECLVEMGQKHKAARHYRTFADRLRAELGVDPEPETQDVYAKARTDERNNENLSGMYGSLEDAFQGFDAFVIYDKDDRFVACNRKFSELFRSCTDLLQPGARFEQILREMVERGIFPDAASDPEAWIQQRLDRHRRGLNTENLALSDGRKMFLSQRITAQGNIVVLFTDVTDLGD